MLVAIDTSVLVAGIMATHESHAPAKQWLDAIDRKELDAIVTTHALAELYGVLTRVRGGMSPAEAQVRWASETARSTVEWQRVTSTRFLAASTASASVHRSPMTRTVNLNGSATSDTARGPLPFANRGSNQMSGRSASRNRVGRLATRG